jgi:hypothetical protein
MVIFRVQGPRKITLIPENHHIGYRGTGCGDGSLATSMAFTDIEFCLH